MLSRSRDQVGYRGARTANERPIFSRVVVVCGLILSSLAPVAIMAWIMGHALASDETKRYEERFGRDWAKTDFTKLRVPSGQILAGGPPPDGIPSIDNPRFVTLKEGKASGWVERLDPLEPVISLSINNDVRAYPLRILMWHEIVNDQVGGEAVVITYCPLCNSSLTFKRTLKGRVLDFGTTGLLRNSDLIMYDRQTETWWQQFTGEAIVGSLSGEQLEFVPSRLESFLSFQTRFPDGRVLVPSNSQAREYGRNPYVGYDGLSKPFLFPDTVDVAPLKPMDRVVAVTVNGNAYGVPLALLRQTGEVAIEDIQVKWSPGQRSALDTSDIARGRDVGNVVVVRVDGDTRADVPYHVTFAFAFRAFHAGGTILQAAPGRSTAN